MLRDRGSFQDEITTWNERFIGVHDLAHPIERNSERLTVRGSTSQSEEMVKMIKFGLSEIAHELLMGGSPGANVTSHPTERHQSSI